MFKVFYWLRLFELTAFYILLLKQTLWDIRIFMILLIIALATFGIPMVILNFNRDEGMNGDDGTLVVEKEFDYWLLNMFINQYLLALGEFKIDKFANNP